MAKRRFKKIGIDIDGVVCDVMSSLLKKCNEEYNLNLSVKDITEWNYKNHKFELEDEIRKHFADYDFLISLPLINDAEKAIKFLKKHYKVVFITSRWRFTKRVTKKWIKKHFGKTKIIFEREKEHINVDLLIDDKFGQVNAFTRETGKPSILFSQPWNEMMEIKEPICRCRNWVEVLLYIIVKEDDLKDRKVREWGNVMHIANLIRKK